MNFFIKLLATFDYHSFTELGKSLTPSLKYKPVTLASIALSVCFPFIDRVFGLDAYAFLCLLVVFVVELASGVIAAHVRKESISSMKLSRFTFKVCYYLVLIALPYVMSQSFKAHDKGAAAFMFDWLHLFLVAQIVLENIVSILENAAVISGKDKTHWISKIQAKINGLIE